MLSFVYASLQKLCMSKSLRDVKGFGFWKQKQEKPTESDGSVWIPSIILSNDITMALMMMFIFLNKTTLFSIFIISKCIFKNPLLLLLYLR